MTDQVCVVVGGGRGMGAAIAREMKKRNYRLSLMSPSDNCENLADELNGIASVSYTHLTLPTTD